jgi:WD40 repeat protein/mono/diheme cytochrome c family protein
MQGFRLASVVALLTSALLGVRAADPAKPADAGPISYYKQIRPIFAQHCQGCHQPAKPQGGFVMTEYTALLKGGDHDEPGVVPGKIDESRIIKEITPQEGKPPRMPKGKDPLIERDVNLIKKWVAEGAQDDTPAAARQIIDAEHPPTYLLPPVITALDYSPDGTMLAVAGYHEVLLHKADGSGLVARLIGLSERIQSIAFSPNGKFLAATGGSPGRFGEVQVWEIERDLLNVGPLAEAATHLTGVFNHAAGPGYLNLTPSADLAGSKVKGFGDIVHGDVTDTKLKLSIPVTFDTVYGASWSPDNSKVAFGCGDNTVRAINAATGEQVLYQGAHSDWVLDTCFSSDGDYLISVSRDRSVKMTEVATQRFIDNVTSITPGALKGGLQTVAMRPQKERKLVKLPPDQLDKHDRIYDEIVIGGADGQPKLYKIHREAKRVIGDDANKVRVFEPMTGRVFCVDCSPEGDRIVASSSLDGKGEIRVYDANDGKRLVTFEGQPGAAYALQYRPDGQQVAAAGFDGMVRLYDAGSGKLVKEFLPVTVTPATAGK